MYVIVALKVAVEQVRKKEDHNTIYFSMKITLLSK